MRLWQQKIDNEKTTNPQSIGSDLVFEAPHTECVWPVRRVI